jgi:hypothetical protein
MGFQKASSDTICISSWLFFGVVGNITRVRYVTLYFTFKSAATNYSTLYLLVQSQNVLWLLFYVICLVATLVPSPLLEFRYFVIPFFLYRLHIRPQRTRSLVVELLLAVTVNACVIWLFVARPFNWPHEPHEVQRFMY